MGGYGVDSFHGLGELYRGIVHERARIEVRTCEHAMHTAALHPEVAGIVNRQDRCFSEVLLEHVLPVSAVHAHDLHALVDGIEQQLGAVDLAHGTDEFTVVVVPVQVMRGLPAEVPAGLDARRHIAQYVADVLIVNDRLGASGRVGFRPFKGRLVRGTRYADGSDTGDWARPGEVAVDQQIAVAPGAVHEVRRWDASVVENDLRVRGEPVTNLADQRVAHARRAALDHDRGEPLGAALVWLGTDHDDAYVRALAVPAGDVTRPVLAAVQHVLVTITPGSHADSHRVRHWGVEIRGASRRPGRLANRVANDVLARRVGRGRP